MESREIPGSISRETAFHRPVADAREIRSMPYYLVERAVRHARGLGLGLSARTVRVWIDYEDSGRETASRTLGAPTDQDAVIDALACRLLRQLHTRREALRRVGAALSGFTPGAGAQADLFEAGADVRRGELYRSLDRVRSRFGYASVVAGPSVRLLRKLARDRNGFVLRTPSLTK